MTGAITKRISVTTPQIPLNPDHHLMLDVAAGNLAGMSQIYENRHRALFRFFFRLTGRQATSEDLTHEVFLRMIKYRRTYQSGDGFESWMYRIARNVLTDSAKKHRLETSADEGELEAVESGKPTPLDKLVKEQDLDLLHRVLRELPDEKRELVVLSRFQGLTYEQIGRIVGCETGTVKVRVFRAIKSMADILNGLALQRPALQRPAIQGKEQTS
jgi:RNA polymerase sigma factor (sigma-70 family)